MPSTSNPDKPNDAAKGKTSANGVYLISPSGAIEDQAPYSLAMQQLINHGWTPYADPGLKARWQRFAGTDTQRIGALERAAKQSPHGDDDPGWLWLDAPSSSIELQGTC
jgi:hypothetical protein